MHSLISTNHLAKDVSSARILIIDQDSALTHLLKLELCYEGYHVNLIQDGTNGLISIRESNPDLIILGWSLPGVSCLEICQRIRTTQNSVPIIVLASEADQVRNCIAVFDAGADDCVSLPLVVDEFIARIRAHLRRSQKQAPYLLKFGELVLDQRSRQVYSAGREIELTAKEFDLLDYLMRHPRQVLTREQMLENVWGYGFMGRSNIVEVYIRYLRLKLKENNAQQMIHTVRGVGYVLRD
jgi:DNA-binding response OmpR family regulator